MICKLSHQSMDMVLYAMMNWIHWKLRHDTTTEESLNAYLDRCSSLDRSYYFSIEPMKNFVQDADKISWESPSQGIHSENNIAQTLFFPAFIDHRAAPTLIILHALMSTSDQGYRRTAVQMNQQGWNVLIPHLPFHHSRSPAATINGSLAITADLIRNGETLRQAVKEIRQLIGWSRAQGSERIALFGTSYGGWIASLLMSLDPVDFAILLQPIIDINHSTFESPLSRTMAFLLKKQGITSDHIQRHAHLTSPTNGFPLCSPERLMVIGGTYDKISPPDKLRHCCQLWNNCIYHEVEQGHFGYRSMKLALQLLNQLIN